MRYQTTIYAFDPDDEDQVDEHAFHVHAVLSSDGDGGLDVEVEAWREDDQVDQAEVERFRLEEKVGEEAWDAAYVRGTVKPGIYKPPRGGPEFEVLGVCQVPGLFKWMAVCRRTTISMGKDDAHGYFLMSPWSLDEPGPEQTDEHEANSPEGVFNAIIEQPDPESSLLVQHRAPQGLLHIEPCTRCTWCYGINVTLDTPGKFGVFCASCRAPAVALEQQPRVRTGLAPRAPRGRGRARPGPRL